MAFNKSNLSYSASSDGVLQLYTYRSGTDSIATIKSDGYFNYLGQTWNPEDIVFAVGQDDYEMVKIRTASSDVVTESYKGNILDGSVTEPKLANGAVTEPKLSSDSVTNVKIVDGSVSELKLGNGSVTEPKLGDSAVTTPKLAPNCVTTPKIVDAHVTEPKLAINSVINSKIVDATITGEKIDDFTIFSNNLKVNVFLEELRTYGALEIDTLNTDPQVIVAAPGSTLYVEFVSASLYLKAGTIPFSPVGDLVFLLGTQEVSSRMKGMGFINSTVNEARHINSFSDKEGKRDGYIIPLDTPLTLEMLNTQPTVGNGELKVTLRCRIVDVDF